MIVIDVFPLGYYRLVRLAAAHYALKVTDKNTPIIMVQPEIDTG